MDPISLGEGNTPLVRSQQIGPALGLRDLYFKLETVSPTGSYKDRFAAAAISDMRRNGKRHVIATSSGNTGSALAAYAAAAGMACSIAIVDGAPSGKLRQMMAYGAEIKKIRGFGHDPQVTEAVLESLQQLGQQPEAQLQVSAYKYSPVGMSGVEAIGHEIAAQLAALNQRADHVFSCAGGGGLTLAVARGFRTAFNVRMLDVAPKIHCVQPIGNDTIAGPLRRGSQQAQAVACTTKISGLQVASVIDGDAVIAACRDSGGTGHSVEDASIYESQKELAQLEGIFSEPAGAVPLTGLKQAIADGTVSLNSTVVCLVTGSGFKDLASVDAMIGASDCETVTLEEWEERFPATSKS
ncbi:pyridoxal-phosphate dependent enzyme [Blastopirellula sp. JC732]|uniref:Pyridoxal-phosphate dependent enzyme n=1 Tax=Blastopirellula sediminis TaxID=2894196 RepID=A0A9X1MQQ3_9BACT|nr:pyridoxal-phosphate dependent enzyme [Blastopirellula sediminis]MCC9605554.1 pyridoxal-phosphate dependent enzyme [Blastopirellula sediminis]MCC9631146.1 pyridoxal-phosphate dependent enzyme [Blastopirellula sediminis]